jgi:L-ascorbate metabolism protein UlaG (beta-lactamase superfamily)
LKNAYAVVITNGSLRLLLVGGPTALIDYGGLRFLTDPTFDPPGEHPRPGTNIVLRKLSGPALSSEELPEIDAVLISHDHHADNLDPAGRAFLPRARRVLSTGAGAQRLGGGATGMEPGDTLTLEGPGGGVTVTAVAAEHGPPEVAARNGPVIGFVIRGEGLPTLYVSGDNASVEVVRKIVSEHGPIAVAVLFVGGAQVPAAWGQAFLTLTAETAVEAARALDPARIIPIHQDGWEHFTSSAEDVREGFAAAGLTDRLRPVKPGEAVSLT